MVRAHFPEVQARLEEQGGLAKFVMREFGVVRYVERTHQSVVLANGAKEGRFISDPYVVKTRPRSVLCVPVLRLGRLVGVLYLENNLADAAFSCSARDAPRAVVPGGNCNRKQPPIRGAGFSRIAMSLSTAK